ncbi:MAG: hypothetical protein U0838_04430 [Chloroflexota bacterium]
MAPAFLVWACPRHQPGPWHHRLRVRVRPVGPRRRLQRGRAFFLLDQVIAHGWVLVATDYVGLGTPGPHPYLIGQGEGRSVLDASRARPANCRE